MCSTGQALCNRLKESVTNVTQPGNQWHGTGNESCDGRGRPHRLLSPCVRSEYSLHPGSCRDLRGVLSAKASVAPAHPWTMESPSGLFLEKAYRAADTHTISSINLCHSRLSFAAASVENFSHFKRGFVPTWEIKVLKVGNIKWKWTKSTYFVKTIVSVFCASESIKLIVALAIFHILIVPFLGEWI